MMKNLEMLLEYCPGEVAAYGAITIMCAAILAVLIAALMMPAEPDKMEETR